MARSRQRGNPALRALGCLVVLVVAVVLAAVGGFALLRSRGNVPPSALEQRCVYTAAGNSVTLDLEQSHYASIIVGLAVKRGLPARAGSIAMATVYQESGVRNLDHGDRDSLGLFQQRPSQGWGTPAQVRDPYHATNAFYDALVKVPDWQTGDINDVAQEVQRSGHPEAYRKHEPNARVIASVLSGHSPEGIACTERSDAAGDAAALQESLTKTFGVIPTGQPSGDVQVADESDQHAWAVAQFVVANSGRYGVESVHVRDRVWRHAPRELAGWEDISRSDVITVALR